MIKIKTEEIKQYMIELDKIKSEANIEVLKYEDEIKSLK